MKMDSVFISFPAISKSILILSIPIFMLLLPAQLSGQRTKQRFGAGFTLGLNASQLDGDDHKGYSKIGIKGGLVGITRISPRLDIQLELLYSQRGAKPSANTNSTTRSPEISLNYAETPVMISFKTLGGWDGTYRLKILTGFSYARLIGSKVEKDVNSSPSAEILEEAFKKNDISWKVGASIMVTPQLMLGVRHTISLMPLLDLEDIPPPGISNLSGYYLSFQATALIF